MKKLVLFLLTLALIGQSVTILKAQTLTSERAYSDYQNILGIYNQAYSDYRDAKNFYTSNQTLQLKEDARQKTLAMLRDRDQLEITYLTALRTKISEISGLSDSDKNNIFGKIDPEVKWYADHKGGYGDNDTLDRLFSRSDEVASRYKANTSQIIYESLFTISLGEEVGLRQSHEQIYSMLKGLVNQGVQNGKLDMNIFNRWFTDIDAVDANLQQNENLGRSKIQNIYGSSYDPNSAYTSSIDPLTQSVKLLGQFNDFLTQVLTSIRNQK